jgi:hypothetical protein
LRGASDWIRGVAQKEKKKREGRSRQRQESTGTAQSYERGTMGLRS